MSKAFAGLAAIMLAFMLAACSTSGSAKGSASAGAHEMNASGSGSLGDYGSSSARGVGSGANYH
jgi:hypothetical protein